MRYWGGTPDGRAAKLRFQIGFGILIYALLATIWPNIIWATITIFALGVPVLVVLFLFFGKGLVQYIRAIFRQDVERP